MIRDFDENGGRPLRGPEAFKRPKLDEVGLEVLVSNEGQASVKLKQVLDLFKARKVALGVRRAKEFAVWLEGQPYMIYAGNLAWLTWHLATYAPPAVARRMVWRAVSKLPTKGIQVTFAVFGYAALVKVHRRRGCALKVRACCRFMLKKWSDSDMYHLAYMPYFYLGELLWLEGKYAEALPLLEKALGNIERYGAFDYRLGYAAKMLHAELCEALGQREKAHACFAAFLEGFGDHSYMPRALHERVWSGFNRTKDAMNPKF
ncbi:MAG: tetratricopeptide repeat protein [Verrucomicrobia bacterium]|jgi:tetratricopeptide (TPR) repeat protein|nr:tetratricopeptide repeat protein [Verrucomicrobiota bacterium]